MSVLELLTKRTMMARHFRQLIHVIKDKQEVVQHRAVGVIGDYKNVNSYAHNNK